MDGFIYLFVAAVAVAEGILAFEKKPSRKDVRPHVSSKLRRMIKTLVVL